MGVGWADTSAVGRPGNWGVSEEQRGGPLCLEGLFGENKNLSIYGYFSLPPHIFQGILTAERASKGWLELDFCFFSPLPKCLDADLSLLSQASQPCLMHKTLQVERECTLY